MMIERIKTALVWLSIAMPTILLVLHGTRTVTTRLRAYALTTPEKWDDIAVARMLRVIDALDAIVDAISIVIPRPPRPVASKSALAEADTSPETPSAKRGAS